MGVERSKIGRGQALARRLGQVGGIELAFLLQVQRPEQQAEFGGRRLEEGRHVDVEGTEAGAERAQLGAVFLAQALHFLGHLVARQHAQRLDQAEGDAARDAFEAFALFELDQRLERRRDMAVDEFLQPGLNLFAVGAGELVAGDDGGARLQKRRTGLEPADGRMVPDDLAVAGELQAVSEEAATALARAVISAATADKAAALSARASAPSPCRPARTESP